MEGGSIKLRLGVGSRGILLCQGYGGQVAGFLQLVIPRMLRRFVYRRVKFQVADMAAEDGGAEGESVRPVQGTFGDRGRAGIPTLGLRERPLPAKV